MALFSSITLLLSVACWCKSVFGYFSRLLHVEMAGKQSDGLTLIAPHIWSTKGQTYSFIKCTVSHPDTRDFLMASPRVIRIIFVRTWSREPAVGISGGHKTSALSIFITITLCSFYTGFLWMWQVVDWWAQCGCWRNSLKMEAVKVGQRFTDVEATPWKKG